MKQYLGTYVWTNPVDNRLTYIDIHYNNKEGVFESVALVIDLSLKKLHTKYEHFNTHTHSFYIHDMYPGMKRIDNQIEGK